MSADHQRVGAPGPARPVGGASVRPVDAAPAAPGSGAPTAVGPAAAGAGTVWRAGAVTGVGSLPGTDRDVAARLVFDELPDFPHLFELPQRGAHAGMIGRGAGVLVDLPVDLQPAGWRLVPRPGHDLALSRDLLAADLEAFAVAGYGYTGPVKIAVAGPLTLAATLETTRGGFALRDAGARADLAASLSAGLASHVRDVAARLPGAAVVVQLDEPMLPAALAGHVRSPSGFAVLPAVDPAEARRLLGAPLAAARSAGAAAVGVHCCAARPPVQLCVDAGAGYVSLDAGLLARTPAGSAPGRARRADADPADGTASADPETEVAVAVEAGQAWFAGVGTPDSAATLLGAPAEEIWHRLGLRWQRWAAQVVLTPPCGLAGVGGPAAAAARYRALRAAGTRLVEVAGGRA